MSAQHESHSPADRDEAFERAAVPMLALTPSGAVVRANASLRSLLNIPADATVSSLVAPLGLTAVQWVLSHLRQAAR